MKILLVEDDNYTASNLSSVLTAHHYLVNITSNGQTALELVKAYNYDLILLDVIVPGLDGVNICRELRSRGYQMPILMLTAKQESRDRVVGLEAGADDYVTKPFDSSELMARIRALLRRGSGDLHPVLTWENLRLDLDTHEVTYNGILIHLTPKEYGLLELFLRNSRRIFSRRTILDSVWDIGEFPGERAVNTQIKGLRQKLKAAGLNQDWLETIYGLGYRLKPEPGSETMPEAAASRLPQNQAEKQVLAAIAQVWDSFKASFQDRIEVFDQAIAALRSACLNSQLQRQAIVEAHQLIGVLGTFNLPEGSAIARQIEQLLQTETAFHQTKATRLSELVAALNQVIHLKDNSPGTELKASQGVPFLAQSVQLLVVDDDEFLTEQIRIAAIDQGFQVEVAHSLTVARRLMGERSFDLILLDLTFPDPAENGLTFLEEVTQQYPSTPVLVITGRSELGDRVAVARLGGRAFLQKPLSLDQLLKTVGQVLPQAATHHKIMVVDDDPYILDYVATLLKPWGLEVNLLANPQQFWQVLEAFAPDLLILDVEMPDFNGLELCQVVRNDPRWGEIPVLFLTAHTDAETVQRVFTVGADDYIRKPIVAPELVARVLNHLERLPVGNGTTEPITKPDEISRQNLMGNEANLRHYR